MEVSLPKVQSIPVNLFLQVHDPSDSQVPAFLQLSVLHLNTGHVPSLFSASPPGQGLAEVFGLPLNTNRSIMYTVHCTGGPHLVQFWDLEKIIGAIHKRRRTFFGFF